MYVDAALLFSSAQTITTGVDTGLYSTSSIDIADVDRDLGQGEDVYFVCIVDTAFTDSGSNSTIVVSLAYDSAAGFDGSPVIFQQIGTFAALSAIGTKLVAKLQPFTVPERYIAAHYIAGSGLGALSAGAVTSFLTKNVAKYIAYNDNVTIS